MLDREARLAWQMMKLNCFPIAAMGSLLLGAVAAMGFSLEPVSFCITAGIAVFLALVALGYRYVKADRADPKLVFSMTTIGQVILVTIIAGPLSYLACALNWPLQDRALLAIDRALGVDPAGILAFANQHPALAGLLKFGYGLIIWPLLGIPIILTLTLRLIRLQQFIAARCIALLVTIMVSAVIPGIGTYYGLGIDPSHFESVSSDTYAAQLRDVGALRDGSLRSLEIFKLSGIVTFPSFHAASAVLYIWALWPVRGFGPLALALNILMLAATPVIGAHYVIDVIAGIALAAASIVCAKWLSAQIEAGQQATVRPCAVPTE